MKIIGHFVSIIVNTVWLLCALDEFFLLWSLSSCSRILVVHPKSVCRFEAVKINRIHIHTAHNRTHAHTLDPEQSTIKWSLNRNTSFYASHFIPIFDWFQVHISHRKLYLVALYGVCASHNSPCTRRCTLFFYHLIPWLPFVLRLIYCAYNLLYGVLLFIVDELFAVHCAWANAQCPCLSVWLCVCVCVWLLTSQHSSNNHN